MNTLSKNRSCDCGSGRKWKHCCAKNTTTSTHRKDGLDGKSIKDRLMSVPIGVSFSLDALRQQLRENPHLMKFPDFLIQIGADLGSSGHVELGVEFTKRALKKSPGSIAAKLNLSVMLGQMGDQEGRDKLINQIPEIYLAKEIVYANYLRDRKRLNEAASVYERIISSGTDFYLVYSNLIDCFAEKSELRWQWILEAHSVFPDNPEIYCKLLTAVIFRRAFDDFDATYVPQLSSDRDERVIGGGKDRPELVMQIQDLVAAISALKARDFRSVKKLLSERDFARIPNFSTCELLKPAIEIAVRDGEAECVEVFYGRLCSDCQSFIDPHAACIESMLNADGMAERALQYFEEYANKLCIPSSPLLLNIISRFDDEGFTSRSLQILEQQRFFRSDANLYVKFRGLYDGYHYATKTGGLLLALDLAEEASAVSDEILNFDGSIELGGRVFRPIDELHDPLGWLPFNLAFTYLSLKRFDEAQIVLQQVADEIIAQAEESSDLKTTKEIYDEMMSLSDWAIKNKNSDTYHNDFTNFVSRNYPAFENLSAKIVAKQMSSLERCSLDKLLFGVREQLTLLDYEVLQRHVMVEQHDVSGIVNSIEASLPRFRLLSDKAKTCLFEAENRFLDQKSAFDHSIVALSYCKTLEIFMRTSVFLPMIDAIQRRVDYVKLLEDAQADKKASQFGGYIRFLKSKQIELGVMSKTLEMCTGKTAERIELLMHARTFLARNFPDLLEKDVIQEVGSLARNIRNIGAHDVGLSIQDLTKTRATVFEILGKLTQLRLVIDKAMLSSER